MDRSGDGDKGGQQAIRQHASEAMIVVCILVRVHVRWPRFQASIEIIQRGQHMIRREIHCETRCAIYIYRNTITMFPPLTQTHP